MTYEKALFGAGCFWGVEARFAALPGVVDTAAGYAGGTTERPSYEQVCSGSSGHAEVVEVTYNPAKISYTELLDAFFAMHNPEQPYRRAARQEDSPREQYRSVLFTTSEEQAHEATARLAALNASGKYKCGVATEVLPASAFWRAEEKHQQYFAKRNIQP
jgi:peptide-methionine (S)-S-oxide reductase